jgi:hypothetical protein
MPLKPRFAGTMAKKAAKKNLTWAAIEPRELVFRLRHLPAQVQNPSIQRLRLFGRASGELRNRMSLSGAQEMIHKQQISGQSAQKAHRPDAPAC